jgi:hypothetical protein
MSASHAPDSSWTLQALSPWLVLFIDQLCRRGRVGPEIGLKVVVHVTTLMGGSLALTWLKASFLGDEPSCTRVEFAKLFKHF